MPKWLKWLINRIDDPIDNLKHALYGVHSIFGLCIRVRVPMKNKNYYGFEIRLEERKVCDEKKYGGATVNNRTAKSRQSDI